MKSNCTSNASNLGQYCEIQCQQNYFDANLVNNVVTLCVREGVEYKNLIMRSNFWPVYTKVKSFYNDKVLFCKNDFPQCYYKIGENAVSTCNDKTYYPNKSECTATCNENFLPTQYMGEDQGISFCANGIFAYKYSFRNDPFDCEERPHRTCQPYEIQNQNVYIDSVLKTSYNEMDTLLLKCNGNFVNADGSDQFEIICWKGLWNAYDLIDLNISINFPCDRTKCQKGDISNDDGMFHITCFDDYQGRIDYCNVDCDTNNNFVGETVKKECNIHTFTGGIPVCKKACLIENIKDFESKETVSSCEKSIWYNLGNECTVSCKSTYVKKEQSAATEKKFTCTSKGWESKKIDLECITDQSGVTVETGQGDTEQGGETDSEQNGNSNQQGGNTDSGQSVDPGREREETVSEQNGNSNEGGEETDSGQNGDSNEGEEKTGSDSKDQSKVPFGGLTIERNLQHRKIRYLGLSEHDFIDRKSVV